MKKYYNIDNDTIYTEQQIRSDYNEMIADGTLDSDIYSDFEYYLMSCMTENNGSLVVMA